MRRPVPKTLAVVDLGSNAVRLQVASAQPDGTLRLAQIEIWLSLPLTSQHGTGRTAQAAGRMRRRLLAASDGRAAIIERGVPSEAVVEPFDVMKAAHHAPAVRIQNRSGWLRLKSRRTRSGG